jgi:hypothetical protein
LQGSRGYQTWLLIEQNTDHDFAPSIYPESTTDSNSSAIFSGIAGLGRCLFLLGCHLATYKEAILDDDRLIINEGQR